LQAKVFFEKVFRLNLKGKTFVRVILTNVRWTIMVYYAL
jgi:hypothetical protein